MSKQEKFYAFLMKHQNKGESFSCQDVVAATGWKEVTFQTYLNKGQLSDFVSKTDSGRYEASNVVDLTIAEFTKKLSQSKHRQALGHNCKNLLSKALLKKSRDNMLLALEMYNRPSLENKIDGFIMLFCAAWEQLLKSIIIENHGEPKIYIKAEKSGFTKTISLRECLKIEFEEKSNVKKNIDKIVLWRDSAVHLLMPELEGITSRIFQSGILNFSSKFEEFSGVPFISTQHAGMISLVGDFKMPPVSM